MHGIYTFTLSAQNIMKENISTNIIKLFIDKPLLKINKLIKPNYYPKSIVYWFCNIKRQIVLRQLYSTII